MLAKYREGVQYQGTFPLGVWYTTRKRGILLNMHKNNRSKKTKVPASTLPPSAVTVCEEMKKLTNDTA